MAHGDTLNIRTVIDALAMDDTQRMYERYPSMSRRMLAQFEAARAGYYATRYEAEVRAISAKRMAP